MVVIMVNLGHSPRQPQDSQSAITAMAQTSQSATLSSRSATPPQDVSSGRELNMNGTQGAAVDCCKE
jgi:hypothetical protein